MFLETLDCLIRENGLNKHTFSIKAEIPYKTIDNFWKKGYENIKLTTLRKIADFFGVSLDYLVYGKEREFKNYPLCTDTVTAPGEGGELTADAAELMADYDKLNTTGKGKARDYTHDLTRLPDYTERQSQPAEPLSGEISDTIKKIHLLTSPTVRK